MIWPQDDLLEWWLACYSPELPTVPTAAVGQLQVWPMDVALPWRRMTGH